MRLAFTNVGAHGHVNPTLAVIDELVARGCDVHYLAPEPFRACLESAGAAFHAYDSLFEAAPRVRAESGFDTADLPLRLAEDCAHSLPQLLARLETLAPDLVVYDALCHGGRLAARRLGIPAARLCPVLPTNEAWNVPKALGLPPPLASRELREKVLARVLPVLQAHGLGALPPAEIFDFQASLNVVQLARAFHPAADRFGAGFEFVGPCLREFPPGDGGDELFISLGTVFNDWPEFYRHCFAAFGDDGRPVRMSTGRAASELSLPATFEVAPYVDQRRALSKSRAFVTHGGINSLMEAAFHGVPVVVVPQMPEQRVNAARVAELGMGIVLPPEKVGEESLRRAVGTVCENPSFRTAARAIGDWGRAAGGARRAADLLQVFASC